MLWELFEKQIWQNLWGNYAKDKQNKSLKPSNLWKSILNIEYLNVENLHLININRHCFNDVILFSFIAGKHYVIRVPVVILIKIVNVVFAEHFENCLKEPFLKGLRVDCYCLFKYAVPVPRCVMANVKSRVWWPVNYILCSWFK